MRLPIQGRTNSFSPFLSFPISPSTVLLTVSSVGYTSKHTHDIASSLCTLHRHIACVTGSGRARCKHAKIFYFKNDPLLECSRAHTMDAIAKDKRSSLHLAS